MSAKFDFIYPVNEPLSMGQWAGEQMRLEDFCDPYMADFAQFPQTFQHVANSPNKITVFYSATTQLSWLWDTVDKMRAWRNLEKFKTYVGIGMEPATLPNIHPTYLPNSIAAANVIKNLVIFEPGDIPHYKSLGCNVRLINRYYVPTRFYTRRTPFNARIKRFQFFGTWHGKSRPALLKALLAENLVDVLKIEKSPDALKRGDAEKAVEAYNAWAGTLNFKSYHDSPREQLMPRLFEARSCGAYVLDLQDLAENDASIAVNRVKYTDWTAAEHIAEKEYAEVQKYTPAAFYAEALNLLGF